MRRSGGTLLFSLSCSDFPFTFIGIVLLGLHRCRLARHTCFPLELIYGATALRRARLGPDVLLVVRTRLDGASCLIWRARRAARGGECGTYRKVCNLRKEYFRKRGPVPSRVSGVGSASSLRRYAVPRASGYTICVRRSCSTGTSASGMEPRLRLERCFRLASRFMARDQPIMAMLGRFGSDIAIRRAILVPLQNISAFLFGSSIIMSTTAIL